MFLISFSFLPLFSRYGEKGVVSVPIWCGAGAHSRASSPGALVHPGTIFTQCTETKAKTHVRLLELGVYICPWENL